MAQYKSFSIASDVSQISDMYFSLSSGLKNKFLKYSVDQTGRKAKKEASAKMSSGLNIPQNVIKQKLMKTKPPTISNPSYEISIRSRFLHVSEPYFNPQKIKIGVSAIYNNAEKNGEGKKRYKFKGAFFGKGKNSSKNIAFKRIKDSYYEVRGKTKMIKRQKIKPIFAFNPATEFHKARISDFIVNKYLPMIPDLFHRKLDQYMSKRKRAKDVF
jgi:hypothetical protein